MPGPEVVYSVAGFVVAGLAAFVAYAYAFAPPLIPVSEQRPSSPPAPGSSSD
jgi:hypothetical protein